MRKVVFLTVAVLLLVGFWLVGKRSDSPARSGAGASQAEDKQSAFDTSQFSLTDAASLWVITNKKRPLQPKAYVPADLVTPAVPLRLSASSEEMHVRSDAGKALEELVTSAKKEAGLGLMLASGYRSYQFQDNLYNRYVRTQGQAEADTQSARPGYSEHQTGLAADLEPTSRTCEIEACFADTEEGRWLAQNAYRFGFVIRYAPERQDITGYMYEPWHARYVGRDLAKEMYDRKVETLEEFFKTGNAATY